MNEKQLVIELAEIEKDKNLTSAERKKYLSIYGAELEKQRSNKYINIQKEKIQKLRVKVIDDIMNIYSNLDEEKKEIAYIMLLDLSYGGNGINIFKVNDMISCHEVSGNVYGTIGIYLDNNIHKELEELNNMHKNFLRSIDCKYIKLEEKLSNILDPEVFNFISQDSQQYKSKKEFEDIFIKENKKIDELDIGVKEKTMLRNILIETIKHGLSYGTMYEQFNNITEYVDKKMSELSNNRTM